MKKFWKSVLALLTASILLLSFAACNGDETSDPAQSGSESTGAESGVKEIAGDYSIDISGAGMALTLYLRIEENGNFKFSNSKEFETDKNSGTVRAADSGYLMVYSTVTQSEREVRTLSGGESFLAALSLALGMADQIQEKSAAISLDILFIDEGFGSLDDRARTQAVKVLQQMAGGSKLIGIISHVTELKQQIDNQLLVTKDHTGSHARWSIR